MTKIQRLLPLLIRLAREERGTSFLELAIAAPILLMFMAGIVDLGAGLMERYKVQQVVDRALAMAQGSGSDNDFTYIQQETATAAGVPLSAVTFKQWVECGGSTTERAWDFECPSGNPARFLQVTVTSSYRPMFTFVPRPNKQADGTVRLNAYGTLRIR